MKHIGLKLKSFREYLGLTLNDISSLLDISLNDIINIENGTRKLFQDEVVKLSKIYGVSIEEILDEEENFDLYNAKLNDLNKNDKEEV